MEISFVLYGLYTVYRRSSLNINSLNSFCIVFLLHSHNFTQLNSIYHLISFRHITIPIKLIIQS